MFLSPSLLNQCQILYIWSQILPNFQKAFKLLRRCNNLNTKLAMSINTINTADTSPSKNNSFIWLNDTHNNLQFIVSEISGSLPFSKFSYFTNSNINCQLFTADSQPLHQNGIIDLILQFDNFPNSDFSHHFANVKNLLLGLDFLCKYHFIMDAFSKSINIQHSFDHNRLPPLQNIDYTSCSYKVIFNLFPNLTSLNTPIINKKHPCKHILEAEGPSVAFRPRRLSLERANALDVILDDLLERKIKFDLPAALGLHLYI